MRESGQKGYVQGEQVHGGGDHHSNGDCTGGRKGSPQNLEDEKGIAAEWCSS